MIDLNLLATLDVEHITEEEADNWCEKLIQVSIIEIVFKFNFFLFSSINQNRLNQIKIYFLYSTLHNLSCVINRFKQMY